MAIAKRILLIEDEPDIAEMLQFFLSQNGFAVHHVAFGLEGLSAARQRDPDLILLDAILPDIDGYAVCRELRTMPATMHIPIIFLTRRSERVHRLAALEIGADDFLAKPFDLTELLLRIRNHIQLAEPDSSGSIEGFASGALIQRQIARARQHDHLAVIEITLEGTAAYTTCYGPEELHRVIDSLRDLIRYAIDGQSTILAGVLDDQRSVIIHPRAGAREFAERIQSMFAFQVPDFYSSADREQGCLYIKGERQPLMHISYQIHGATPAGTPA